MIGPISQLTMRGRARPNAGPRASSSTARFFCALTPALDEADTAPMSELESRDKVLHQHPELSMQDFGDEVTRKVGVIGVVCVMKNGAGPGVSCASTWMRCRWSGHQQPLCQ